MQRLLERLLYYHLLRGLQWRNYRGSRYSHAVGPVRFGGGPTKNKNIVGEKCEFNNQPAEREGAGGPALRGPAILGYF